MAHCINCRSNLIDYVQERFKCFRVTLPPPDLKQDNYCYNLLSKYRGARSYGT